MNDRTSGFVRPLRAWAVLALLVSVGFPSPGPAQVIQGVLKDGRTGAPVRFGTLELRIDSDSTVARTAADSLGAYSLTAPRPGIYQIFATGFGYRETPTARFTVGEEGPTIMDVYLAPEPIALDSLGVESGSPRILPHLERQGFYSRMDEGFGEFITPEEIEERHPRYFGDLFRDIAGLNSDVHGSLRWPPRCRDVTPSIWLDGIKLDWRTTLGQAVSIDDIEAVEIYIGAARVPLQYGGLEGQCVLLVWTKIGSWVGAL